MLWAHLAVVLLADLSLGAVLICEAEAPLLGEVAGEELDVSLVCLRGGGAVLVDCEEEERRRIEG
jgi:hypothetical protein